MKIGIIGCGVTGLTAAYELSKAGYEIEAFEAGDDLGGIAGA
ncbi:MAG: FAD-dependent oxidoreductase, partial [Pseudomonadota bacterium]